jgi:hypothetical protein
MPVIGFLNSSSPGGYAPLVAAFRQGLNEAGYIEGRNVTIEYRWAELHYDRIPELAAEIAPEPTGHGLPLSKCEAYNRVYDQRSRSS